MKESEDIRGRFKFPKKERLHSKKLIDALFSEGASFRLYPFVVKYMPNPLYDADCHQILISVAKKRFKRAVDRNRVKRLVREAYRLHKHKLIITPEGSKFWLIGYIYIGKEIHDYAFMARKLNDILKRLNERVE